MSWYDELVGRLSLPEPVMVAPEHALPGRAEPLDVPDTHYVNGHPIRPPFPEGLQLAVVAMGCFWGAEKGFWELDGVYTTAVGYVGGYTPNPTYEEVCSGRTGHAEAVLVVFDPAVIDYAGILRHFWENHDPTQGMRQGNDRGTQYRSAVWTFGGEQADLVRSTAEAYGKRPRRDTGRSPRRSRRCPDWRPSTMPRAITSSTWPRTPADTVRCTPPE